MDGERVSVSEKHAKVGQRSVMLVIFFDQKGIVHHEFVPRGQMVNKHLHQEILARLRDAVQEET